MKASWLALFKVLVCITYLISLIAIQPSYAQSADENIISEKSAELSNDDLQRISGELKYIDEVLTSSVLSYIFSGDEKWLTRYQENEPKLTSLIEQLLNQKSIEDFTLISSIEKTNQQLVAIETEAIALVQKQQRQSAMALINSDHYHLLKADYMSMLSAFIESISHRSLYKNNISEDETDFVLSLEEANWAANNKIKVGVELSPPILSIENGQLSGLSGELINRIANKAGLELEIVVGTWHEIFSKFKAGEIDVIPNSYMQEYRKEYGQFSKPYFLVRELFFVKDDNRSFHANTDLTNATVAIPEGYTTIDKVNELFPAINVVKTPNLETSIQLVLTGKVDALLDSKVAVNDYIKGNNISGLREIDEDVIYPNSLHILTTNKHPILHSIMVKGLESLKMSDIVPNQRKWITQEAPLKIKQQNDTKNMLWLSLGALTILLIIGSITSSLVLRANDKELANKFSSPLFRRSILGGLLILSNVLILTAFLVTKHAENQTNQSLQYSLNSLLTTTHQRLMQWSRYELNHVHSLSKDKQLVELVEELLLLPNNKQALTSSPIQTQIRQHIRYKEGENQGKGFFIISLDNLSL